MSDDNLNCNNKDTNKNYPILTPKYNCPVPTPSIVRNYKSADYIPEKPVNLSLLYAPVVTPSTSTAAVLTYLSPTPTPTNKQAEDLFFIFSVSPTPTTTLNPSPTPSKLQNHIFSIQFGVCVFVELDIVISFLDKNILLYHSKQGNLPTNPVYLNWRVIKGGITKQNQNAEWTIPWKYSTLKEAAIEDNPYAPHPQWSDEFKFDSDININSVLKLKTGTIPLHVTSGDIYIKQYPNKYNKYTAIITCSDTSSIKNNTAEYWYFTVEYTLN